MITEFFFIRLWFLAFIDAVKFKTKTFNEF